VVAVAAAARAAAAAAAEEWVLRKGGPEVPTLLPGAQVPVAVGSEFSTPKAERRENRSPRDIPLVVEKFLSFSSQPS
jgi:hypothetical protein